MPVTPEETKAAQQLADALLEFIVALQAGLVSRHPAARPAIMRDTSEAPLPPAPRPAASPSVVPAPASHGGTPAPHYLTTRQTAEYLNVGQRLLWALTAPRGPLPATRLGRTVRYSVTDLDEFMNRNKCKRR